ncbi:MAG: NAD(P)H-dependent oxidoreductase [Methanomicrobiales archaeon]|nr:NAD(P)H-dependent oxidoreductase [Methanomicrobiales archaeon]
MSVCIVYHSETGNTRKVAEAVAKATGAVLIPVKDLANYNKITMYLVGAGRAHKGEKAAIEPSKIDVSAYDLVVVGSPVWAWHPTPAANAAIAALAGCEGKKGMVFATCGGKAGETLDIMKRALEERQVKVGGSFSFSKKELGDAQKLGEFIEAVKKASA